MTKGGDMPIDEPYVLWSVEHHAWWAPHECGYVDTLADAGIYPKARASAIVEKANIVSFNECAIPVRALAGAVIARLKAAVRDGSDDWTQPPSGLRGDPGAPRTVNADARDRSSSSED